MCSHSGATLSKMLECLINFIAKCKLSEFAIGFCQSKKMYVTIFFCDQTNVQSKLLLLEHLPNLVGHCPMSDSNLQPWVVTITPKSCRLRRIFNNLQKYKWNFDNSNEGPLLETLTFYLYFSG